MGDIRCPFCFKHHPSIIEKCPETGKLIPEEYKKGLQNGTPAIYILAAGYRGCGKTCFLTALLYYLCRGDLAKKWLDFSIKGLNPNTFERIKEDYIEPIIKGQLPQGTPVMFPDPLLLEIQGIPGREFKEAIFGIYDVGGEIFTKVELIKQHLPENMLNHIDPLIFLIDLPTIVKNNDRDDNRINLELLNLVNKFSYELTGIRDTKENDLLLYFTKADIMWYNKTYDYGPFLKKFEYDITFSDGTVSDDLEILNAHSEEIKNYLEKKYPVFCKFLFNNFRNIFFGSLSSLGQSPQGNRISEIKPINVFHPILWALYLKGYVEYKPTRKFLRIFKKGRDREKWK